MEQILSEYTVSITELRKAPGELLKRAAGQTVAILSHNKPAGYIVSPEAYRAMLDGMEDKALGRIVEKRKGGLRTARVVKIDDLLTCAAAGSRAGMEGIGWLGKADFQETVVKMSRNSAHSEESAVGLQGLLQDQADAAAVPVGLSRR